MAKFNENAVREAAYYMWQNSGCPSGNDEYFWSLAIEQVNGKTCKTSTSCTNNKCSTKTSCKPTTIVKKASASSAKKTSSTTKKKTVTAKKSK